jgi:hypothetical protein
MKRGQHNLSIEFFVPLWYLMHRLDRQLKNTYDHLLFSRYIIFPCVLVPLNAIRVVPGSSEQNRTVVCHVAKYQGIKCRLVLVIMAGLMVSVCGLVEALY